MSRGGRPKGNPKWDPTLFEALAREIGASKNTVSKAYRSLARKGYLSSAPRRGFMGWWPWARA